MFSSLHLLKYADLADAQKEELQAKMQELASAVNDVCLVSALLEGSMPAYDLMVEIGFADQAAYEEAKTGDAYQALLAAVNDTANFSVYEFAAYGSDRENFTDRQGICHRVLIFHMLPEFHTEELEKMLVENIVRFPTFVPKMVNCKLSKIVETSGTNHWDYAFECDYEEIMDYFGQYLMTPYHWGFIDRFFEPSAKEFFIDPNLASVYCFAPTPFLANYR